MIVYDKSQPNEQAEYTQCKLAIELVILLPCGDFSPFVPSTRALVDEN